MIDNAQLAAIARDCRVQIIRMLTHAGSGHPGGSLSVIDLVTTLYFQRMRHDPKRPGWPDRDRLILSKGHAVPAQYVAMARAGYFPQDLLITLRKLGSPLQGHPDRTVLPGIEAATGSLGEGLSIAIGMALQWAAQLAQSDQAVLGKITGARHRGVEGGHRVALGEDQAVTVGPVRALGIVTHSLEQQRGHEVDHRERAPGMSRSRMGEHPDDLHAALPGDGGEPDVVDQVRSSMNVAISRMCTPRTAISGT